MATTFYPLFHSNLWSNWKQGANIWNIHQLTAWPVPHACAQPYHPGSGSHGQLFSPQTRTHQHGISSRRSYDMNAQSPVSMAASPLPGWCCCGFNSHVVEMLLKVSSKHTHLIGMAIRAIIALGYVKRLWVSWLRLRGETLPRVKGSLATLG